MMEKISYKRRDYEAEADTPHSPQSKTIQVKTSQILAPGVKGQGKQHNN